MPAILSTFASTSHLEYDAIANKVRGTGKPSIIEVPEFHITQTYKRYKFFGVRTEEQIRRVVEGN